MRKLFKILLVIIAVILSGIVVNNNMYRTMKVAVVEKHAIVAEISPTQGIKVIMDGEDQGWGSWVPVLQLLVILIGTYGGIKLINKYTK